VRASASSKNRGKKSRQHLFRELGQIGKCRRCEEEGIGIVTYSYLTSRGTKRRTTTCVDCMVGRRIVP